MQATLWSCLWGGLVTLLLFLLSSVFAEECIIPKVYPHFITSNDLQKVNDHLCYKCYNAPRSLKFQVQLHEIKFKRLSSIMIYVDATPHHINKDCGMCNSPNTSDSADNIKNDGKNDKALCHECEMVTNGIMFELYLRLDPQVKMPSEGGSACQNIVDFNISLTMNTEKQDIEAPSDCDDGFMVSLPLAGDTCIVNSTFLGTETHCLVPTCSDGIRSPDESNEKIEYKFKPHASSETCLWQLNTEQRKHVTLIFSQNIKPHITIFEESLMNPKWDVEWCPTYNNEFRMVTDTDTIFVVYHSSTKLTKKGSLSITTQIDLCPLPPSLENGSVEFQHLESGTVALYMCDKGFSLLGPSKLHCKNGDWHEPPVCLQLKKDKLMSDAPMGSIESVDSVNVSVLTSENGTFIASAADSEPQGKMPMTIFPDQDVLEDSNKDDENYVKGIIDTAEAPVMEGELHVNKSMTYLDTYSNDSIRSYIENSTKSLEEGMGVINGSKEEGGGIFAGLFNLSLEDDMTLYAIIGATGLSGLIIVTIISVVIYRKRYPVRLGLGRKFDTFQNPIYEKTVVRMPMQAEDTEVEVERKKSDAEEMSDCTVLE